MEDEFEKLGIPRRPSLKNWFKNYLNQRRATVGEPLLDDAGVNDLLRVQGAADRGVERLKALANDPGQGGV